MDEAEAILRPERRADAPAIAALLEMAFPGPYEARLVADLRAEGALAVSLVAEAGGGLVGHAALSPVTVEAGDGPWLGLGPLAVRPDRQRRGLGKRLTRAALDAAAEAGAAAVFVLGEPGYYAMLGFEETTPHGWRCVYPAPPEAFRVRLLDASRLPPPGIVRYHPAFDAH